MKIVLSKKTLTDATATAKRIINSRTGKPILKKMLLTAGNDGASLVATDLEVAARIPLPGSKVNDCGAIALCPVQTALCVKGSKERELTIDGNRLLLKESQHTIESDDSDCFPDMPQFPKSAGAYYGIACADLLTAIQRTEFAVVRDEPRFSATVGILLELDGATARLVSTDGRRMALATCTAYKSASAEKMQGVVPIKAMEVLARLLKGSKGICGISLTGQATEPGKYVNSTGTEVHFQLPNGAAVFARLVDGRFPPYQLVIPKTRHSVELNAGRFMGALRAAANGCLEEDRAVVLTFTSNRLDIRSATSETFLPVQSSQELAIRIDPKYLLDMLAAIPAESKVSFAWIDHNKPIMLTADNLQYVVVPLAVADKKAK